MKNFTLKNTTKTTAKNSSLDSFVSNVSKKRSFSLAASWKLLFLFLVLTVSTSYAQSYREWTSTGTDWNTSSNWNPSGITYGQLEWKGNGNATSNNNVSNPYSSWRFYFSGSKAYMLTGSKVKLYDWGGRFSWILSDATANQILNLPIDFNDSGTRYSFITNRSTGTLTFGSGFNVGVTGSNIIALRIAGTNAALPAITFNGTISGSRPIDIGKDDSGADQINTRVFFNGNNSSYSGVTTLYAGTLSIPANTALGSGSLTMGNGTVTNTLAVTDTTTRTQGIVINNTSSAAVIDVASTKTFTMSGVLSGGATNTTKIGKSGPGTLTLSGTATYNGKLQIGDGTVIANNNTAISTNTTTANRGVDLGLNVGGTSQPNNVSLLANNGFTVGNSIYVAPNTSSATRTIGLNGSGSATFDKEIYLDGNLTITGGSGTTTVSGAMVNTGGVIVNTGTVVLSAANTYTGATTVTAGTLTLGIANALPITASAGDIRFTGGTPTLNLGQFNLGTSTATANSAGLLDFDVNTTVNLGAANGSAYSYYFKDSSAQTWSATTITIGNWVGTAGATAGTGAGARRIFIGSGATLTAAQLNKIQFTGFAAGATQLASGEIVPRGSSSTITTGTVSGSPFCAGATGVSVPFTYSAPASFPSGGSCTFKAQLSDASGSFASPTDLQTVVSDASGSQSISVTIPSGASTGSGYRIRVVSNSPAVDGADNGTNLTISATPTTATNTSTQTICTTGTATLSGNSPSVGTGAWTVVSGPSTSSAQFANTTVFNTVFTPAGGAGSYVVRWTISNSPCSPSTADATITVNAPPTTATNTSTQTICTTGTATLSGNSPSVGTGAWTVVSGPSTSSAQFANTTVFNTVFTPAGGAGSYVVRWTISNSPCSPSTADATITVNAPPTTATNTSTQTICTTGTATLSGNSPSVGTGAWTVVSGPSTSSAQFANTTVFNTVFTPAGGAGSYVVRWTISNSPCSPSTADATITVNTSVGGTATATSSSVCLGDSTTITLTGNSGTIQWQRSENGGSSWTSISGATSSTYTTPSLNVATSYRAVVTNGSCASANSSTATVSISEANQSNAGNATYNSGWSNAQNDSTTGFGAWTLSAAGGAGFFVGSSDVNNANTRSWGMYSNGTGNTASATRTVSMGIGNKIAFSMDNGNVTSGKTIGFGLQNASGQNLMELYFTGGDTNYTLSDNAGTTATSVGYTTGGLDITVSYTAANTYSVTITGKGASTVTYTGRTFSTQGGGQLPAQIRFFNVGAGSGSSYDLFFNSLSINNPVITTQPSAGTQSFCIGATPTNLTVAASGSGLSYQWFSNTTASNTGGTNLGSGNGAQTNTYTPQNSTANTRYYYCVVTGGCSSTAVTSNVSGAITVNPLPTPTFTAQPGATACATNDVTYTTQSGQSNYIWTVPGVLNTDYSITSGGIGTGSNTVTLKWLTTGSKTVTINYTTSGCTAASATSSTATTVSAAPTPTFTSQPGASACANTDVTYTTQSGQSNYIWTVPGVLNTDYSITSGGTGTGSNTVTLKWLTTGSKTVTINYTSGGCTAGSATSSTATTVTALPTPTFTAQPGATACANTDVTYTTQSGQSNYIWTVPGVLNTDYSITSGGIGTGSNTVTLKWLTTGSKTVTINYTTSGCTAASATSSTATTVSAQPTTATNGSTQTICSTGTATLSGNTPSVGTGAWSVVSGPSTSSGQFSNTATPGAIFTPAGGSGSYVVRWTITNGSCSSTANATITVTSGSLDGFNLQYWPAAPGAQQVCSGSSFTVYGQVYKAGLTNTTSGSGTGIEAQFGYNTSDTNPSGWSTWAAATFGSDKPSNDEYQYNFTPPSTGTYYFTFRYRLNGCAWQYGGYKSDGSLGAWNGTTFVNGRADVTSSVANANAGSDISQCNNGSFTMAANAVSSPAVGTWTVVSGTATITSANSATSTITGVPLGTSATLKWRITNGPCNPTEDLVVVTNSATNTWIGSTSTDWNTAANWCGGVPTSASNVVIPSGTTFSPSIYQTANAYANSVTIDSGAALSMSNAYSLSITSGGSIINNGTFNAGNGTVNFAGGGTITGTILFYNVNLNGTVSFSNAVTINNNLRISSGGAVTTNSPTYGSSSSLQYYSGGSYNRNLEWNATSGAGYPNNVTVENNTVLNVKNGNNSYKKIAGNLTITTGSTFKITDMTTGTPSALGVTGISVEVLGDILNNGTIISNGTTNTRLKGNNFVNGYSNATATTTLSGNFGGDLEVAGNFTDNANFSVSQRAVFFTGTTTQVVDGTAVAPFNIDYIVVAKSSGSVLLNKDLLVGAPLTGNAITFVSSADIIDLNGHILTIGTSGINNSIVGSGSFKGSSTSSMIINGTGDIGTINFDQTTQGVTNVLNNLTVNRTSTGGGFSLGSDVTISNTATLTAGTINLGSANMTIGASASIAVSSPDATKMIIASGTGELRKTFTAAGSFTYPVGDNVGTAEYSPATLTFSGSPSGYAGVRVQNAKHPNINVGISDYITRYWPVSSTISGPNCTAAFTYLAADENGTPANYFGGRYLSPDWYCMDDVDQVSRIISKTGLSAFGDFTVYNPPVMTSTLTSSAATICANTSTNLQVTIGGGDSPYTVGPFTVVYYDSVLATNVTVNSYTSGANIPVSPTASTTYTLQSVTSSKACYSSASDTKTVSIGGTSTYASGSWTPSAPVSTSTAIIDGGTYNVAANIDACSLEVKNSAVVTIPSTYKVTLSGALTVETGSSFTLENDTNLVQTGGTTNPNTGSIRVKRNSSSLYLLDYTLWSSSVANQNLYSFSPDTAANRFYIYDEPTDQYNSLSSNNSFTVGRGYLIRVPRTFSATTPGVFTGIFTGKPNSGDITYGMSKSLNGFNAVGNPYPSQINVHNFIDANISNIQGTLYFWRKRNNPLATSYATLTKLAYAANAAAGGDTGSTYYNTMTTPAADWVINVGQGFFVQAKSASNLVFTNTMRRGTNNGNQFFRTSNKLVEDPNTFKLNLTSTNGVFSQMVLGYSPEYTLGIDDGIDGFNINSTNYLCSTIEGAAYVIQGRPEFSATDVVPLEYKIENADQYSIAIEQLSGVFASQDVFLKDKLTNTIHDLKSGPYDFGSESGNFKERFEVVYESPLAVNQNSFNENNVVVYKQNQELMVNTGKIPMSNVKVYDIRGRLLIAKDHIDATQVKLFTGTTQEVLLVKITSDSYGTVTKKVVN